MTTRRPDRPNNNDLDRPEAQHRSSRPSSREPGSFLQRVGLTGLLAGTAALVTTVIALINTFDSRNGHHPPDAPPSETAVAPFNISDYWYGTPANTKQPLIFHLMVNEPPSGQKEATPRDATDDALFSVLGTVRNPCQGNSVLKIESGTWSAGHLIVHAATSVAGKPLTLDVFREAQDLNGTLTQDDINTPITLHRGDTDCPK